MSGRTAWLAAVAQLGHPAQVEEALVDLLAQVRADTDGRTATP